MRRSHTGTPVAGRWLAAWRQPGPFWGWGFPSSGPPPCLLLGLGGRPVRAGGLVRGSNVKPVSSPASPGISSFCFHMNLVLCSFNLKALFPPLVKVSCFAKTRKFPDLSSNTGMFSSIREPGGLRFFPAEESQHRVRVFKPFRPGPRGLAGCLRAGDPGWARCVLPRASPPGLSQCRSWCEGRALGGKAVSSQSAECPRSQHRAEWGPCIEPTSTWPHPLPPPQSWKSLGTLHAWAGPSCPRLCPRPQGPSPCVHVGTTYASRVPGVLTHPQGAVLCSEKGEPADTGWIH